MANIHENKIRIKIPILVCGVVDVGGDNHLINLCTSIYCHYAEHTDELQLER
jgi:hypothetical protein